MATEQEKTLAALKISIQMEIDGKEYYLKASQESSNELGKELLQSLAAEEDVHRQKFEQIYEVIRAKKSWSEAGFQSDGGKKLRTIFAEATTKTVSTKRTPDTELETVQGAMAMEIKTYDFYKNQSKNATYARERDFYEALAAQENEHHLILLDYYEYLKDPAAWFVEKEHPSLDGG